eukprot:99968-Hanusia_phi.AAC.1
MSNSSFWESISCKGLDANSRSEQRVEQCKSTQREERGRREGGERKERGRREEGVWEERGRKEGQGGKGRE